MSTDKNKLIPELRFPEFFEDGDWVEKTLGSIAEIVTGSTPSTTEPINYNGDRLFVSPADINDNRYITQTKTTLSEIGFSKTRKIKENSVLFVCIGSTIGKVAQNQFECATNQQLNSLIPYRGNSSNFLYSILYHNSCKIASIAGNHAVPIINKTSFSAIKLDFPSNPQEQQKIASCLSSLDEVIAAQSQKLATLKDHKKGLMQNLFPTNSITNDELEITNVPNYRFPEFLEDEGWVEKKLGDKEVSYFVNEKTSVDKLNVNSYVSTENMLPEFSGVSTSSKLPSLGNFTKFKNGDILISNIRPYLKKVWKADKIGGASNDVLVFRYGSEVLSEFLECIIKNEAFINYVMEGAKGVKMPRGDKDYMQKYIVFIPSKMEQQKIASCLSSLDDLITAQTEKIAQLKLHKKGLMQGLFPKSITN
jgi:type I restriction enzyme S subunit